MNKPIRILLVDDSPYFLEAAREFLQIQEPRALIEVASEEQDALAKSVVSAPDIILLDLNLSYVSGLELIPLFRKHLPKVKIIVLTMMSDDSYRAAALEAGADAFVNKSAMTKTLVSTINNLLKRGSGAPPEENSEPPHTASPEIEFRLLRLAEHLPDLIYRYEFGPVRGFTYVSPSATAMTGYTPEEHYADPDLGDKLVHPDDLHHLKAIDEEKATLYEPLVLRWVRKDSSIFWTEQRTVPIFDTEGKPIACEGIVRDITERKQAEEAVHRFQHRYLGLFNQSHDAVFILDLQGNHLDANERAAHMLGYSLDELKKLSIKETSAELEQSHAMLDRLIAGETLPVYERLFRKKSGEVFPVNINVELVRDEAGKPLHVQSVVRDITERKQADEALRVSEEKYRRLADNAEDIIYRYELVPEMRLTYINAAVTKITGYSPEECLSDPSLMLNMIHPDDLAQMTEYVTTQTIPEEPLFMRWIAKDGSVHWMESRIVQVHDEAGQLLAVEGITRDMTERKHAEEKLRESEDRYRDLVENSSDLICTHDLQGNLLSVNEAALRLTGYPREQLLRMSLNDLLTPQTRVLLPAYLRRIRKQGRARGVMEIQTASGEIRFWEYDNSLRSDGVSPIVRGMARDITERKQAEEKIQRQFKYLNALRDIDNTIASTDDMQTSLDRLIHHALHLEIISKGALSQSAKPEHSASKLKKCQIVLCLLLVTDQKTSTFGQPC